MLYKCIEDLYDFKMVSAFAPQFVSQFNRLSRIYTFVIRHVRYMIRFISIKQESNHLGCLSLFWKRWSGLVDGLISG